MNAGPALIDPRLTKALSHHLRVHILNILNDGPNSPSGMAKMVDAPLNLISYHVKVLLRYECVELIRTRTEGGRKESVYRATERQFFSREEWEAVEPKSRKPITASILQMVSEDAGKALATGLFDVVPNNHLSRSPIRVDREGWREIVDILARSLDEVLEVHSNSGIRAASTGDDLTDIRVVMMQFPISDDVDALG